MTNQALFAKCPQETCVQGPLVTDSEGGEIMGGSCAVLVEKTIDSRSENHNFTKEDYMTNTRFGSKIKLSFPDMGLSTFISSQNKDFSGKQLPSEIGYTFYRLGKEDQK